MNTITVSVNYVYLQLLLHFNISRENIPTFSTSKDSDSFIDSTIILRFTFWQFVLLKSEWSRFLRLRSSEEEVFFFFNLDLFGEEAEYVSHFRKRGLYLWQEIANLAYSQKLMVLSHSTTLHNRIIWCLSKQMIYLKFCCPLFNILYLIQCNVSQTSSTLDLTQRFENTRKFIWIYTNMDIKFMVHGIYEWKMLKYHFKQNSIKIKAAIEFQNYVIPIRSKLTHGASTTSFSLRIHWIHFNCSYSPLALIFFGWKCERFRLRATSS